jgi:GNAT superfamily N-acetyltransferase
VPGRTDHVQQLKVEAVTAIAVIVRGGCPSRRAECVPSAIIGATMIDRDQRIGSVRDRLLGRYLGFAFGGLHFEARDISAEIAEARQMIAQVLGHELRLPPRPNRFIHLSVVTDEADEIVGKATREVGFRDSTLVVAHKELRIRRAEWRRRGFGSALLEENRSWYQECGVECIVMEAEGDGSAFAAVRGFDFDVASYASRPKFKGLSEREVRFAAVEQLINRPAVQETVDDGQAPHRESVVVFLERLKSVGVQSERQVRRFQQRLPRSIEGGEGAVSGDEFTFIAPHEIAAFGQDEPLQALDGQSLGLAVLGLTSWSGIRML